MSTGVWTVSCQTGCCCGSSWWCPCIIYLTGLNHILASLCPQVYGLYVVKLAVAMVLAVDVQVIIYLTGPNHFLASLCPQVYGLYVFKLAVAMVLAFDVQVIIYLTGRNHILASLCPQVYGLYVIKLAVAIILAVGVQVINAHYYFSNLIRWVGSRRVGVGAPGTTGSHETKLSVIRSFLAHPRDQVTKVMMYLLYTYKNNNNNARTIQ